MTKRSRKYIQVYKQFYGEIPKDVDGRLYDIHHIDGDFTNNDPSNLIAVSIKEHYEIHKNQKDWGAAWAISKRFNIDPKEKSEITRQMNLTKSAQGLHWSQLSSKNGTHPFQNIEFQRQMAEQAKLKGNRSVDRTWICEKCGCSGKGMSNYSRYHGENCGKDSKSKGKTWMNNGSLSKMIEQDDVQSFLNQGWILGRGSTEITKRRTNKNGTTGRIDYYIRKTTRPYIKKMKS